jgi:hypothetical protein
MASIPTGNDAFLGGSRVGLTAPGAVSGSIASADTAVSDPISGVRLSTVKYARQNQGTNIGIPYARLCPVGGKRDVFGLGPPPNPSKDLITTFKGGNHHVTPTEDLRSTTLAFILGKRSATVLGTTSATPIHSSTVSSGKDGSSEVKVTNASTAFGLDMMVNSSMAPGLPGTERFQQMCSFEFLQRYFTNVLCTKGVSLNTAFGDLSNNVKSSGLMRTLDAITKNDTLTTQQKSDMQVLEEAALNKATFLKGEDISQFFFAAKDSDLQKMVSLRQGIFDRDESPFLRGKGNISLMVRNTSGHVPEQSEYTKTLVRPDMINRCLGDELAFSLLERVFEEHGLTDWRPDGIVLSVGANDPSDKASDEMLSVRDGQLYNVRVQGPALATSWTGNSALQTLPLDKVFVVIVADVVYHKGENATDEQLPSDILNYVNSVVNSNSTTDADMLSKYLQARDELLTVGNDNMYKKEDFYLPELSLASTSGLSQEFKKIKPTDATKEPGEFILEQFRSYQRGNFPTYDEGNKTSLVNFRVRLATSSQMVTYSTVRFDSNGNQLMYEKASNDRASTSTPMNGSRMGLRLGKYISEYIVGGWCIGSVLDSAASRGSMPSGSTIGVRTAPNSSALNLNVDVSWWSADRMYRHFANVENSTKARYQKSKPMSEEVVNPVNIAPVQKRDALSPKSNLSLSNALTFYELQKEQNMPEEQQRQTLIKMFQKVLAKLRENGGEGEGGGAGGGGGGTSKGEETGVGEGGGAGGGEDNGATNDSKIRQLYNVFSMAMRSNNLADNKTRGASSEAAKPSTELLNRLMQDLNKNGKGVTSLSLQTIDLFEAFQEDEETTTNPSQFGAFHATV